MRREILKYVFSYDAYEPSDTWPCETFNNRLSKKARSRDIKREHRFARRKAKHHLDKELHNYYSEKLIIAQELHDEFERFYPHDQFFEDEFKQDIYDQIDAEERIRSMHSSLWEKIKNAFKW